MKRAYLLAALIAIVLVSGCAQQAPGTNQTNPQNQTNQTNHTQKNVSLIIDYAPASATLGVPFTISWTVSGPKGLINHTAIHYSFVSHPGTFGKDVGPPGGYAYMTPNYASGSFNIPGIFAVNITPAQVGDMYWRAHAIVDGSNYWTGERSINVGMPTHAKVFTLGADDSGFYYENNTPAYYLNVNKGDTVVTLLNVRPKNVRYGGLDFRGCGQNSSGIMPGSRAILLFNASSTCAIASYRPSTNVVVYSMDVIAIEAPTSTVYGSGNTTPAPPANTGGGGYGGY